MIRFVLCQTRQGKNRLSRWYVPISENEKNKLEVEISRSVSARDRRWTNFVEYRNYKLIYRQYAGLIFTFCVDVNENELAIYEFIHFFVEVLDKYFQNVCELDVVFHFDRVYHILDEILLCGEVVETSHLAVIEKLKEIDKLD
ncbi:putative AP-2 complex subunit sigma-1 [Cardiosporidium cionae]|uniref:AP complex subunit sigma n=1 Tax=Cardiosporidium cionae TaxID=476202 RepID=A0ABQ7J4T7_9APIC|nr:putative AP-2 complex subunit sigma-1 [Cardiosporidium cionae]|eukprot:KAF8819031.1 putative AP-2 complex subunit sigma-1 [Cardiosporidium cionae]